MTREQFATLVARLEHEAAQSPSGYRRRVLFLAALGYAYLGVVILVILALLGVLVWLTSSSGHLHAGTVQAIFGLGLFLSVLLRSLWVRLPPPEGLRVSPSTAGQLMKTIEAVRAAVGAPRVHHIIFSHDLNASVTQVPRLGFFGWPRNYLTIGWPLLQALSLNQFRAVLAHEFGHLSGEHGYFGAWIYRIRQTWSRLMAVLDQPGARGGWMLRRFFRWYAPYFNAYTFVLARSHEYEADLRAARLAGGYVFIESLAALALYSRFLETRFWPDIWRLAEKQASPPQHVWARIGPDLRQPTQPPPTAQWLAQSLAQPTDVQDTHPSLQDRSAALKAAGLLEATPLQPNWSPWNGGQSLSAAQGLLGEQEAHWAQALGQVWRQAIEQEWSSRYAYAQDAVRKLGELEAKAAGRTLNPDERFQLANLTLEFRSSEQALPIFEAIVAEQPESQGASYTLGRLYLERDNEQGAVLVERVMSRDWQAVLPGCELLYAFYHQRNRDQEAQQYRERWEEFSELLAKADRERQDVSSRDHFMSHGFDGRTLEQVRTWLAEEPMVTRAYVVRKTVSHLPQWPCFIVGIIRAHPWWRYETGNPAQRLVERLVHKSPLPSVTLLITLDAPYQKLRKVFARIVGAEIFRR